MDKLATPIEIQKALLAASLTSWEDGLGYIHIRLDDPEQKLYIVPPNLGGGISYLYLEAKYEQATLFAWASEAGYPILQTGKLLSLVYPINSSTKIAELALSAVRDLQKILAAGKLCKERFESIVSF